MHRLRGPLIIAAAVGVLAMLWRWQPGTPTPPPPAERTWPVMGTFASVTLRGDEAIHLDRVATETAAILESFNQRLSVYLPDSDLSRLNGSEEPVRIGPATRDLLLLARHYTRISDGAFDPTAMPLIRLWGFSGGQPPAALPAQADIDNARQRTGIGRLDIGKDEARFTAPGMKIDLGGIAKGFAIDRCYEHIIGNTPLNAIFNLGGNIRCHGSATPERAWRIGVQNPFTNGGTLGTLALESGMAVATSGNYERFITIDGKRYAHIIDPRSGRPVEGMAGVTVVSTTGTETDALSTALFVLGIEEAAGLLARTPAAHALLIPDRVPIEIYISEGLRPMFTPSPAFKEAVRPLPPPR